MPAKWQRFKVDIPKAYGPVERESIAQDIIDFIVDRTLNGKDKKNKAFRPGYSEGYANTREGQLAGKRKGKTPNLKLTGDMLDALGDYISHRAGELIIGFENGTEENAKADGNVRGTYGHSNSVTTGRDFMGIASKDLKSILADYPLGDKGAEERFLSVLENLTSKTIARKEAKKIAERHDLDFEELIKEINAKFK